MCWISTCRVVDVYQQKEFLMKHKMLRSMTLIALLSVMAIAIVGGIAFHVVTTHADAANSITVDSTAQLIGKVALRIPVTVTCTIPAGATWPTSYGNVTISQAGKKIASASGYFGQTCDGTAHTYQVEMSPPPESSPFHTGVAVAIANFYVSYGYPTTGAFTSSYGDTGYVPIKIVK